MNAFLNRVGTIEVGTDRLDQMGTPLDTPWRIRLSVMSRNQGSTRPNQEMEVGIPYRYARG